MAFTTQNNLFMTCMQVVCTTVHSFLLVSSRPCYECTIVCLTVYLTKDIWVISSLVLLEIKPLWTFAYRFLHENNFSFFWAKCPRVQLPDYTVIACLVLYKKLPNCLQERVSFYDPTNNIWVVLSDIIFTS